MPSSRDGQRLTFSRRIGSLATATLAIIITGGCGGSSQQIPKLQSINISPATALINVGEPEQFAASGQFSDGSSHMLTDLSWTTANPGIATISATGLATGASAGTTKITLHSDSHGREPCD